MGSFATSNTVAMIPRFFEDGSSFGPAVRITCAACSEVRPFSVFT